MKLFNLMSCSHVIFQGNTDRKVLRTKLAFEVQYFVMHYSFMGLYFAFYVAFVTALIAEEGFRFDMHSCHVLVEALFPLGLVITNLATVVMS